MCVCVCVCVLIVCVCVCVCVFTDCGCVESYNQLWVKSYLWEICQMIYLRYESKEMNQVIHLGNEWLRGMDKWCIRDGRQRNESSLISTSDILGCHGPEKHFIVRLRECLELVREESPVCGGVCVGVCVFGMNEHAFVRACLCVQSPEICVRKHKLHAHTGTCRMAAANS